MRIVVGADDEGAVADAVVDELQARGHDVTVLEREQWPEVARKVGEASASGEADQGMVFLLTGTGTAMAANKVPGVRAARWSGTCGSPRARGAGTTRTCS